MDNVDPIGWSPAPAAQPVDDGLPASSGDGETAGMSVEMPVLELYSLADGLRGGRRRRTRRPGGSAGRPRGGRAGRAALLDCSPRRRGLAGELEWLGATVAAVAGSWLALDGTSSPAAARCAPG